MEKTDQFDSNSDFDAAFEQLNSLDSLPDESTPALDDSTIATTEPSTVTPDIEEPNMSEEELDSTMSQLNKFIGTIYQELNSIDFSFRELANYFFHEADDWAKAAEKKKAGLSSDEGKTAMVFAGLGVTVKGFGAIVKVWQTKKRINQYKEVCSRIVSSKGPHIDSMVNLALRAVNFTQEELEDYLKEEMNASFAYNSDDCFYEQKKILMSVLNRYRQAQFIFDQLIWIRNQMIAWQNGQLEDSESVIPSYRDINQNIFFGLHPYIDKAVASARKKEIEKTCDSVVEEYKKMANEKYGKTSPAFVISLCDNELMATLLESCSEETRYKLYGLYSDYSGTAQKNAYRKELLDSKALSKAYELTLESIGLKSQMESHDGLMIINGILLCLAACIPIVAYSGWGWWNILPCVIVVAVIGYRTIKSSNEVEEKYNAKLELLSRWRETSILRMTGFAPAPQSITIINNKVWSTIIAAIIGAFVGSIFLPPIGTIVGLCIGAIVGSSDEDVIESDGRDYNTIKTGSYTKTKVWTWIISIVVVAEIVMLFIK